jgi:hypothetical protein
VITVALLVLCCLLAVVVFVQLGALVELFKQVEQIRAELSLVDVPTELDLGRARGRPPSAFGLPTALDRQPGALVLFLSTKCSTCASIAAAFRGAVPLGMWIVVEPIVDDEGDQFVEGFQLAGDRTQVDYGGRIADRLGLDVTPSAVMVADGRMEQARTVPSSRQAFAMLPQVRLLNPSEQPITSS